MFGYEIVKTKKKANLNSTVFLWIIDCEVLIMYDCGFTKENNWFRYRAAAIIVEDVLVPCPEEFANYVVDQNIFKEHKFFVDIFGNFKCN